MRRKIFKLNKDTAQSLWEKIEHPLSPQIRPISGVALLAPIFFSVYFGLIKDFFAVVVVEEDWEGGGSPTLPPPTPPSGTEANLFTFIYTFNCEKMPQWALLNFLQRGQITRRHLFIVAFNDWSFVLHLATLVALWTLSVRWYPRLWLYIIIVNNIQLNWLKNCSKIEKKMHRKHITIVLH